MLHIRPSEGHAPELEFHVIVTRAGGMSAAADEVQLACDGGRSVSAGHWEPLRAVSFVASPWHGRCGDDCSDSGGGRVFARGGWELAVTWRDGHSGAMSERAVRDSLGEKNGRENVMWGRCRGLGGRAVLALSDIANR